MKYLIAFILLSFYLSPLLAKESSVDLDVSLVKTYSKHGFRSRVIVKYEHDATGVIVELIQNSIDDGEGAKLLKSWDLRKVKGGKLFNQIQYIKDAVWKDGSTLILKLESKSCTVGNIDSSQMEVSCK